MTLKGAADRAIAEERRIIASMNSEQLDLLVEARRVATDYLIAFNDERGRKSEQPPDWTRLEVALRAWDDGYSRTNWTEAMPHIIAAYEARLGR